MRDIASLSTTQAAVSSSDSYLISLSELKTYIETATQLSPNFPMSQYGGMKDREKLSTSSMRNSKSNSSKMGLIIGKVNILSASSPCRTTRLMDSTLFSRYLCGVHVGIWSDCVAAGSLSDASLIWTRHLSMNIRVDTKNSSNNSTSGSSVTIPVSDNLSSTNGNTDNYGQSYPNMDGSTMLTAFKSIPDSIPPSEIVAWIRTDILPLLHLLSTAGTGNGFSIASELANELCRRATLSAELLDHPFEALIAAELAVLLVSSIQPSPHFTSCNTASSLSKVKTDVDNDPQPSQLCCRLLKNLQIQAAIWRSWGAQDRPCLFDVESVGLTGLVWRRLWTLRDSEVDICEDITHVIEPLVKQFGGDVDDDLQSWVRDTIEQNVILLDNHPRASALNPFEEEEETTCSLSRLISVVAAIRNPHRRVTSLLLLFQVPAIDRIEEHSLPDEASIISTTTVEGDNVAEDEAASANKKTCTLAEKDRADNTVNRLYLLAQAACLLVEPVAAEALTEAIRLQRRKTLAASYGVISFDPRDRHQIRAAASVIALRGTPHSLRDAIEFASSWGNDSADLTGLLTRAVVHRSTCVALNTPSGCDVSDESILREKEIRNVLGQVPPNRFLAVVEDSCTYLIESLEGICEDSHSSGHYISSFFIDFKFV